MGDARVFYVSSNGDRWSLTTSGSGSVDPSVLHEGNPSAGGHRTVTDVETFLTADARGPEHQALRALLDRQSGASGGQGAAEVDGF